MSRHDIRRAVRPFDPGRPFAFQAVMRCRTGLRAVAVRAFRTATGNAANSDASGSSRKSLPSTVYPCSLMLPSSVSIRGQTRPA